VDVSWEGSEVNGTSFASFAVRGRLKLASRSNLLPQSTQSDSAKAAKKN
jgi:hypothetical protein